MIVVRNKMFKKCMHHVCHLRHIRADQNGTSLVYSVVSEIDVIQASQCLVLAEMKGCCQTGDRSVGKLKHLNFINFIQHV